MKQKKSRKEKIKDEENKTKKYKVKNEKKEKNNKDKKPKKKRKIFKWIKRLFITCFILGILAAIVGIGAFFGIINSEEYKVSEEDFKLLTEKSKIVTQDGTLVTEIASDENRKEISLSQMGEYIPKAFIAIEDERFYEHNGVDIKRTIGAALKFLTSKGTSTFGGSTITQQLIKNSFDDKDDSGVNGVKRKIREIARAYNLEKIWSKDQILERYLNYIYMGGYGKNILGVQKAAEYYFSKNASELSLAESAYLAGINNTPNSYNPFENDGDNAELIKKRTIDVIWKMKELGMIESEELYRTAIEEAEAGLKFKEGVIANRSGYSYHTAALVEQVIDDLMEKNDWTYTFAKNKLEGGGYTIYSTVNPEIQATMEEEYLKPEYIYQPKEKNKDGSFLNKGHSQSAMVIMDHSKGYVVGCVGGLGSDVNSTGLNRATQTHKQPGSSIKPLACEAAGLNKGVITAANVFDDSPTTFGNYNPHNAGGYSGIINVRKAIAQSSNIVHVKIMRILGPDNSAAFLKTVGINVPQSEISLPLALGATDVSPLQMAAAYSAIANDGVYIEPTFYTKVVDSDGEVILEATQESRRVLSIENAYVLKNLLTAPIVMGNSYKASIPGMDVGAKTGSSNNYKERWFCGFSPYYAAATWSGFDNAEATTGGSINNSLNIWSNVMRKIHKDLPNKRFVRPAGVVSAKICLDSGLSATEDCTNTTTEVFVRGTVPGPCTCHEKLKICKETGKIANDYCTDVEEKIYPLLPPTEEMNLWKTNSKEKEKFEKPTEVCDKHKAPETVEMPNVVGKKLKDAKKLLEDKGLKVKVAYKEDKKKADSVVLAQDVKEKEKIEIGKTVTLTVNKIEDVNTNTINTNTEVYTNTEVNTNTEVYTNTQVDTNTENKILNKVD